jgi:broad specificity phosphatase PhoE
MKRIVLVRHGETEWHATNRYAGSSDITLTSRGVQQAAELAEWARTARLSAIWCSPLSRARVTAQTACDATGLTLNVDGRLRELHFGRGEGMTDLEMQQAFSERRRAFLADPVKNFLPDGEDPELAAIRVEGAVRDIAGALEDDQRALIVAHNTLIRLLLCRLLGIALGRYRSVFPVLGNVTRSELGFRGDCVALLAFNAPIIPSTEGTE